MHKKRAGAFYSCSSQGMRVGPPFPTSSGVTYIRVGDSRRPPSYAPSPGTDTGMEAQSFQPSSLRVLGPEKTVLLFSGSMTPEEVLLSCPAFLESQDRKQWLPRPRHFSGAHLGGQVRGVVGLLPLFLPFFLPLRATAATAAGAPSLEGFRHGRAPSGGSSRRSNSDTRESIRRCRQPPARPLPHRRRGPPPRAAPAATAESGRPGERR